MCVFALPNGVRMPLNVNGAPIASKTASLWRTSSSFAASDNAFMSVWL